MISALRTLSVVTFVVVFTACGGDSHEERIARATEFLATADYDSAIIELKSTLQQEPDSVEARWLLGKAYLESGDVLSAEKELQLALRLGWPHDDVIPALAESLLAQGKYSEIEKLKVKGLEPAAESSLLAAKAQAAMARGENREARRLVNKALDKNPESTDALIAKTRILASQGDLDVADGVLETLLALDPGNSLAWSLLGDIRMRQQRPDDALVAFDKAIAARPDNYGALFKRALLSLQVGNYEVAQRDASAILRIAPQHPGANYVQGLIHFQAGKYGEAVTALSSAEPAFKRFPQVLFYLGSAQLLEGKLDQAGVQASRFKMMAPENIPGRKLLATIRLQQGKYEEVQELLRPVLDANPDDVDALNLMSNALLRDGKADEGITLLSRVAELQPDSAVAQVRLGAGLLVGGKGDDAAQHMETALELNPEFQQADILLVMNHVQKQDYDAAIQAAQAYRRRNLTSTTPLNLLGRVYQAAGQPEQATESFEKALALDAGDPAANHGLAQMAVGNEDLAAARQYYATVLEHHENYLPALIQLALLDAREENGDALVEHLEQAMAAHPVAIQPRLLLGRYYVAMGDPQKVALLFASLEKVQQQSPQVLQLMAMAQLAGKDPGAAQLTLEQLADATPGSAATYHMMAMAAAGSGDTGRAEKELQRALEIDEGYIPSRVALARIALANKRVDEFEQHLAKLESLAPENPQVLLLRAASAKREGDSAAAVKLAEQAFNVAPGTATLLAFAAHKEVAGDHEGALELYRGWLDKNPEDIPVTMAMANSLQVAQQSEEANIYYAQVLRLDPDNVVALNNLAWQLREENPEQALEYARRAKELSPDSPDVLDTLAMVEYSNKDYKRAQRSIERALSRSPDNPTLQYHSAMISAAIGDNASAIAALEKLLDSGADFAERDQATTLYAALRK